jgi:HEAT repeat protein
MNIHAESLLRHLNYFLTIIALMLYSALATQGKMSRKHNTARFVLYEWRESVMPFMISKLIGKGAAVFFRCFISVASIGLEGNAHVLTSIDLASEKHVTASSIAAFATPSTNNGGLDPAIIAALIGLGGVIIGALIAGVLALYQARRTTKAQQEQLQIQHQQAQEQLQIQHQQAQEILKLQQELQEQAKAKERELQRKEMNAAAALAAMEQATTRAEQVKAYRDSLRADPRIARLQILDMDRPLEVTNIYVRLRLHQDTKIRYQIEKTLLEAELQKDPNEVLRAQQMYLEQRAGSAREPDEAIRTYKHCIIVGDPGAGKTTLLKYLALKSVENQLSGLPDLPIHVELNDFANSGYQDVLDFASSRWETRYGFPKADAYTYMEEQLKIGNALLLLDALDESVRGETVQEAEDSYRRTSEAILQLATRYHQSPIVVTARKASYQQHAGLAGFTQFEVLDFRAEDIQQFIRSWFDCRPIPSQYATAADLQARLARNSRIQALAANPLLLSLIVLVYEEQLDLPDRRAELYNRCVETLLTKWDTSRDIRRLREFKPERKRQLLEVIAWHFHQQGRRYFPESELLTVIANFLPRAGLPAEKNVRILEEIAAENGLLKEQAQGWYGFLHLTLQEYFVAQYVTDHQQLEILLEHRADPWWEEVFLLYAGRVPDASPLFQRLLGMDSTKPLKEDIFCTNLLLAGRCLATQPTIWKTILREEVIERLFHILTNTPYSLTQGLMADALSEIGGREVNTHLLRLLADEQLDIRVRESIASALGQRGERSVAPELLHMLADEQLDIRVRESIAYALGRLGERSIVPELLHMLADEQLDIRVRWGIDSILLKLAERSDAPQMVHILAIQQLDITVRWNIAYALGKLGERSIVPELLHMLADEQLDIRVRESIAFVLGLLGECSVIPEMMHMLADEQLDIHVREYIADALGEVGGCSVAPELLRLLADEQLDIRVRESIASALGQRGERSVASELLHMLANEQLDIRVRQQISVTVGELQERSIIPEMMQMLIDEQLDAKVRWGVVLALGELGERSVAIDLVRLLADEQLDASVRWRVSFVLGELGERKIAPDLVRLLADEQLDPHLRVNIARALGKLGERTIVPDMLRMLIDEQLTTDVRDSVANALGKLGDDDATVYALATILEESALDTVYTALWKVSRRVGLRVFLKDTPEGNKIDLTK